VLLIYDETITGFCKTGNMFGAQTYGVTPDMIVTGKGVSNGVVPLAAMIARADMADAFLQDDASFFAHGAMRLEFSAAFSGGGGRWHFPVKLDWNFVFEKCCSYLQARPCTNPSRTPTATPPQRCCGEHFLPACCLPLPVTRTPTSFSVFPLCVLLLPALSSPHLSRLLLPPSLSLWRLFTSFFGV
jgi:hypothetical protein